MRHSGLCDIEEHWRSASVCNMDSPHWNDALDDENVSDSQAEESFLWGGKDGLIFLLDASLPMFDVDKDGECWFRKCLQCCRTTMLNKIIGSEQDLVGAVLFGTAKTQNVISVPHVSTLQELEKPSAQKLKQLGEMLESADLKTFREEYGHSKNFALADAFWVCQTMFAKINTRLSAQRILLFTNTSEPHAGDLQAQHQARKKAEDLGKSGISLELLHMGENFNASLFYKDLLLLAREEGEEDGEEWIVPDPANRFEELMTRICRRNYKKRSVGKVYFTLLNNLKIGVGIYNLIRPAPKPKEVRLSGETNETVKMSSVSFRADTAEVVLKTELRKYQSFGGRKIMFTPDEVKSISQITDVGLKLLGFKHASDLKIQHHCKPSSFVYPTEELVKGSTRLFAQLLERCLSKGVVALCVFTPRQHSAPRFVALLPQREELDECKVQVMPPGFHLVYLPFADQVRKLPLDPIPSATPEQVELAKNVVEKLKFTYSPYQFDNPKLQTQWRNIETLALGYDEPREVTDYTVPNQDIMDKKLGALADEFVKATKLNEVSLKKPSKRPDNSTTQGAKQPKILKTGMEEIVKQGKVEGLKVDELKSYLQSEGVKVTGLKKADLVREVYTLFRA
ncbi:X-ray repair cross-complementing protein 6 isoform X1 [Bacillus rossius redtenbacheri]|uniref:X-ray repair cross-complementing protein 6 isoform X1 n=1 Tax=Bacillus rossius redtenbacheri TaxID=93214 RepID=UPI002FDEB9EC